MQYWKVNFSGYAIVKAPDAEQAEEIFWDDREEEKEITCDSVEQVNNDSLMLLLSNLNN